MSYVIITSNEKIRELAEKDENSQVFIEANSKATKKKISVNEEKKIENLLKSMEIPTHVKGFQYLESAITMMINAEDPMSLALTKDVYPGVAKKFHTTTCRTERAIRHAIEIGCSRGDEALYNLIFGYDISSKPERKLTNGEFLHAVTRYLK